MGKIVWLASYPESGALWISMFFTNLLSGSKEPCKTKERDAIVPAENSAKLYQPFFRQPLAEVPVVKLAEMRPKVHIELAKRANEFLFLRTHNAAVKQGDNLTITPEATAAAIYIVRNPLDIAAAYGAAKGRPIERTISHMAKSGRVLGKSSKRTYEFVGSWSENVESWTTKVGGRFLCLKFEDLLENPLREFSQIVEFLGMKANLEQITNASDNSIMSILEDYKEAGIRMPRHLSPLELLRSGAALTGRRLLTTQQIATIAATHHDQMRRFGYWT